MSARKAKTGKTFDFIYRLIVGLTTFVLCLWMMSGARAADINQLKKIDVSRMSTGDVKIDLHFSEKISKEQLQPVFDRNFLQFALKNVNAYPAINKKIGKFGIEKLFAYQYDPSTARTRIIFDRAASELTDKVKWQINGSKLEVVYHPVSERYSKKVQDKIKQSEAAIDRDLNKNGLSSDEKELLQKVISTTSSVARSGSIEDEPVFSKPETEKTEQKARTPTASGSFVKMVSSLSIVLGIMLVLAWLARRYILGQTGKSTHDSKLIQVISNQAVGPKQSVSLVKVTDRYMLLGIAEGNVSLIADYGKDLKLPKKEAPSVASGFDGLLKKTAATMMPVSTDTSAREQRMAGAAADTSGSANAARTRAPQQQKAAVSRNRDIRGRIRQKLENFKQL